MSSPIGTIELLVKFDSMKTSFVDAMKEAINKSDLGEGAPGVDLSDKLDSIIGEIRLLRVPLTGSFTQLLHAMSGRYEWLKPGGEFREKFKSAAVQYETLQKKLGVYGLETEEIEDVAGEFADVIANKYLDTLKKVIKAGPAAYALEFKRFIDIESYMEEALRGSHQFTIEYVLKKLFKEWEVREETMEKITSEGIFAEQIERWWWRASKRIGISIPGTTETLERSGFSGINQALMELGATPAQIRQIMTGPPTAIEDPELIDFLRNFLDNFYIEKGTPVPTRLMKTFEEILTERGETDPIRSREKSWLRYDILAHLTRDTYKRYLEFQENILPESEFIKLQEGLEEIFKEPGARSAFAMIESKLLASIRHYYEIKEKGYLAKGDEPFTAILALARAGAGEPGAPIGVSPELVKKRIPPTKEEIRQLLTERIDQSRDRILSELKDLVMEGALSSKQASQLHKIWEKVMARGDIDPKYEDNK